MHNLNNKALIHKTHRWWWLQQERVDRALQIKNKLNKFGWNESLTDCGGFLKANMLCLFYMIEINLLTAKQNKQNCTHAKSTLITWQQRRSGWKKGSATSHTTILYIQHCNSLKSPGRPDLFLSTAFSPQHQRWYYGDLRMEKHECVYILKFLFWE